MDFHEENDSVWIPTSAESSSSSYLTGESNATLQDGLDSRGLVTLGFFSVNAVVSLVGNALSLAVFLRGRLRGTPSSGYLAALAVADTGSAVTGVLLLAHYIFFYLRETFLCNILTYVNVICTILSAWFVVCFTVERYISVCHPLRAAAILSRLRQRYVVALLTLLPAALYAGILIPGESGCDIPDILGYQSYMKAIMLVRILCSFPLPFPFILLLNLIIIYRLRQHSRSSNLDTRVQEERRAQNTSITRTLLLVSLLFFVCNFPMNVYQALCGFHPHYCSPWVAAVFLMLYNLSFSGNFFVYAVSGARFRASLRELLGCRLNCAREDTGSETRTCTDPQ